MKKTSFVTLLIISVLSLTACKAQESPFSKPVTASKQPAIKIVFQGSDVVWGFDFLDTNRMIFTERGGAMKILDVSSGTAQTVQNVPQVEQYGQGGLLDVTLHPDFAKNKWVYFSYAIKENNAYETRIARARLIDQKLQDLQILFTSNSGSSAGEHFGSRIMFDGTGHFFFSVGDRGNRENAQNLTVASGKIFRLTEDGKIPADNPFVKQKNAVEAIWSYGHRNPQGLYYDLSTKTLWEQEHGPKGGDEINIIQKGKNYGWPVITYGREYTGPKIGTTHKEGLEQPIYYFIPSIAPSGLAIYKGDLYSGALALTHLNRLVMNGAKVVREERLLENKHERVRNIRVGPDDLLYISTDSGKILQLKFIHI